MRPTTIKVNLSGPLYKRLKKAAKKEGVGPERYVELMLLDRLPQASKLEEVDPPTELELKQLRKEIVEQPGLGDGQGFYYDDETNFQG